MVAPVRCCFDVLFLLFALLFALSVHQALDSHITFALTNHFVYLSSLQVLCFG